ncbi:MAG TPA: hypothetical protein VEK08_07710 [Planctomycetota bacterium]|nr:hypothetical protein [Planctomycetota bacterium]
MLRTIAIFAALLGVMLYAGDAKPIGGANEIEVETLESCFDRMKRKMSIVADKLPLHDFIGQWVLRTRLNISFFVDSQKTFSGTFNDATAVSVLEEFCRQIDADWTIAREDAGTGVVIYSREKVKALNEKSPKSAALVQKFREDAKFDRVSEHNAMIFEKMKAFIQAHPKLNIPPAFPNQWEYSTRHVLKPKNDQLSRQGHDEIKELLEMAVSEKFKDDKEFHDILELWKKWDFTYTMPDDPVRTKDDGKKRRK